MSAACPRCGEQAGPTARFCPSCGTALIETQQPPATTLPRGGATGEGIHGAERRHLTVMFCDLAGSTALSELLDPEETGELVLAYQEMGRAVVTGLGGHVAQYLGDGLLSYFGYPTAHEDDAERAVRAGLAVVAGLEGLNSQIRSTAGVWLAARVGIHSGQTIVGAMGSADRSDTSVFGSTPNIAARIESHAAPGTVVISDATRQLLDSRFRLEDGGTPEMKGLSRPVQVWSVVGVDVVPPRAQVQAATPLVNRHAELGQLRARLERARHGEGQTVLIWGEPGVGKSRLVQAVCDEVTGSPHVWLEFQCSQLATGSPLQPVIDVLERTIGATERNDTEERRSRLARVLAPLGEGASAMLPYVAELLGINEDDGRTTEGPELRRRRALDALAEWAIALAGTDQLAIIVAEDVHWSDPTSLELLRLVADYGRDRRIFCLLTKRPETLVDLPAGAVSIEVSRLSAPEGEELVRHLAAGTALPPEGHAELAERGDGIPLFIEELVKAAQEGRTDGHALVPDTLQALLAARLDRLGPARQVAQAASVLGREFPLALLEAVAVVPPGDLAWSLARLEDAGLVITRPSGDEVACLFRHALIQDAAYSSLLLRQRRDLHAHVADVLEAQFQPQLDAAPDLMAHHLAAAGQHLSAAEWYERAGRRAAVGAALGEAVAHYRSGLATLAGAPGGPEHDRRMLSLNILLANALMGSTGLGGADLLPIWERAIRLAEELGDHDELTSALNGAAVYHADHGDDDTAIALAERIVTIAEGTGSRVAALRGHGTLGMEHFFRGNGKRALDHSELAISLSEDGDFERVTYGVGHDERVFFHTMASWNLWWLGRPDAGLDIALEGSRQADRLPSSLSQAMACHAVALIRHLRGEGDEAIAVAAQNLRLAEAVGLPFWRGLALLVLGAARARRQDEAALDQLDQGFEILIGIGNRGGTSFGLAMLAEAQVCLGRFEQARATAEAGLATSADLGQPFYDPELLRLKAVGLLDGRSDHPRRAEALVILEDSLAMAKRFGAASWALQTTTTLVPLLSRGGEERERSRSLLSSALASMGDGHDTQAQSEARRLLVELAPPPARTLRDRP